MLINSCQFAMNARCWQLLRIPARSKQGLGVRGIQRIHFADPVVRSNGCGISLFCSFQGDGDGRSQMAKGPSSRIFRRLRGGGCGIRDSGRAGSFDRTKWEPWGSNWRKWPQRGTWLKFPRSNAAHRGLCWFTCRCHRRGFRGSRVEFRWYVNKKSFRGNQLCPVVSYGQGRNGGVAPAVRPGDERREQAG